MDKQMLANILARLKENGFKYSLEAYISGLYCYVREIFIYNPLNKDSIKRIIDKDMLKNLKVKDSYVWYLGDRKEAVAVQMKRDVQLTVPEFEAMQTDNYAEDSMPAS
jgi:hypothetical protein